MDYTAAVCALVGAAQAAKADRRSAEHGTEQRADGPLSRLQPLPQCQRGALLYGEVDPEEAQIHIVDDFLAARVRRWDRHDRGEEAA